MEIVGKEGFLAAALLCFITSVMISTVATSPITTLIPTATSGCPGNCSCEKSEIVCTGLVPDSVPGNIETVVLLQIYYWEQLHDRTRFCNVIWDNVVDLTVQFQMYDDGISLQDGDLDCLSKLQAIDFQHLGSVYPVFFLTNETFSGLTNVAAIQLSGWGIYMQNLRAMFSVRTSLQQLTHLNISNSTDPLVLDQDFIDDLSLRPLELLDISFRDITFDLSHARGLCKTLTTLLMLGSSTKLGKFPELCESLKFIDISRTHDLEKWLQRVPCGKSGYQQANLLGPLGFGLFRAVTTVHANGLITSTEGMRISSCKLVLEHSVTELHFSQNLIPEWEFIFWSTWPNQSHTGLRHIEITSNNIKTMNQNVLTYSPSLEKLVLSDNKLSEIPSMSFQSNTFLSSVDLTSNRLSSLPVETFLFNPHLEEIRIANNSFTQIHFTITHLFNLTTLDVRFNLIQFLDSQSMNAIDALYENQTHGQTITNNNRRTFQVLLQGNPFVCDCKSLDFQKWFTTSPVFTSDRQSYRCTSQERHISMFDAGIDAAQEDCELAARQLRTILMSTVFSIVGLAATVVATIGLCKRYKRKKLQKKLTDQLRLIQEENIGCMFPVFLSYCSEDAPFVAQHVRQQLRRHLHAYTDVDKELVCEGDLHFVPGRNTFKEMERCVAESAVFLAVVSESYCKSPYCNMEISEAKTTGKPVILIMKEHVDISKMELVVKNTFKNYARSWIVEEKGRYSVKPGWDKICEGIITAM